MLKLCLVEHQKWEDIRDIKNWMLIVLHITRWYSFGRDLKNEQSQCATCELPSAIQAPSSVGSGQRCNDSKLSSFWSWKFWTWTLQLGVHKLRNWWKLRTQSCTRKLTQRLRRSWIWSCLDRLTTSSHKATEIYRWHPRANNPCAGHVWTILESRSIRTWINRLRSWHQGASRG